VIFANIRKAITFMICTNVAEVLAIVAAAVTGSPLPLLPLQILYLNMLTDVLPALALGVGEGPRGIMDRPPRRRGESILTRSHWLFIGGWGVGIAACVLAALAAGLWWLGLDQRTAVTLSFLTIALAKLWFGFNLREVGSTWRDNTIVRNRWLWGAIGLCLVLAAAAVYLPGLSGLLKTRPPGPAGWAVAVGLSLVPLGVGQAILAVRSRVPRGGGAGR
jgi:Ca2+-transporting ATPase